MFDPHDIPDVSAVGEPATDDELNQLSRAVGGLPTELAQALRVANGVTADVIQLYSTSELPERNATYEVPACAPDVLLVGCADSSPLLLGRGCTTGIFLADWGALDGPARRRLAGSLHEWVRSACPLPRDDQLELIRVGDLHLLRAPTNGLKDLFRLKAVLGLDLPATAMREALAEVPTRLARGLQCPKAVLSLQADANHLLPFVGVSKPGDDNVVPAEKLLEQLRA